VLNGDEVHLWRIDLEDADDALYNLLSRDEQERADRMADEPLRNRFIQARGTMRSILGRYLDRPATEIRFEYGERGKPSLAEIDSTLGFNLSHSHGLALLALTRGDIGVDLEPVRKRKNLRKIGERVFPVAAQEELSRLQDDALLRAFFRHWTALEASAKLRGISLFDHSSHADCNMRHFVPASDWVACVAREGALPHPEQWRYYRFR
jgi:4'-phosphopantetheinyl transferase